jgi:hypothetical protein
MGGKNRNHSSQVVAVDSLVCSISEASSFDFPAVFLFVLQMCCTGESGIRIRNPVLLVVQITVVTSYHSLSLIA